MTQALADKTCSLSSTLTSSTSTCPQSFVDFFNFFDLADEELPLLLLLLLKRTSENCSRPLFDNNSLATGNNCIKHISVL